jgi:anti-sigma regulatory factor (Ser/Thr protein kinase)
VGKALSGRAVVDDAVLVASELVANAIEHGGGTIDLRLDLEEGAVRIQVTNEGTAGVPAVRTASTDDDGGRGLAITQELAARWGWGREAGRTTVWAEFASD